MHFELKAHYQSLRMIYCQLLNTLCYFDSVTNDLLSATIFKFNLFDILTLLDKFSQITIIIIIIFLFNIITVVIITNKQY